VCAAENRDGCVRLQVDLYTTGISIDQGIWTSFTVLALLAVLLEEGPAPITIYTHKYTHI
jgi:hypothetical protein